MRKIIAIVLLSCMCTSAFAGVTSSRDKLSYTFGDYARHTVITNPPQPYQPVFSWRTHVRFDGSSGQLGYHATYIGETDSNGILNIVVPRLPFDPIYCGRFIGERVAVGSPFSARSNSLNFIISAGRSGLLGCSDNDGFPPPRDDDGFPPPR